MSASPPTGAAAGAGTGRSGAAGRDEAAERAALIEVARGRRPADLFIRGGRLVNVYSGEIYPAHVAVCGERIAYVGPHDFAVGPQTRVIDAEGRFVAPGYIEPHSHPFTLYTPAGFAEACLLTGCTAAFCDNLPFESFGRDGFDRLAADLRRLPFRFWWLARYGLPAASPEEPERFHPAAVAAWLDRDDVAGLGEYTRWPELAEGDPRLLACMVAAHRRNKRVDGHTAGCSAERLNAVVAAGIDACHEAIQADQARDRLRLGLWTTLRHSSLRPDLDALLPLLRSGVDTRRIMFTNDGGSPAFIADHGLIDGMLRKAVAAGVPAIAALQMATVNPATFFGLDRDIGGIAPGRLADVLLLDDLESFRPRAVIVGGRAAVWEGRLAEPLPAFRWGDYGPSPRFAADVPWDDPGLYAPEGGAGAGLPAIEFVSTAITRAGLPPEAAAPGGEEPLYAALVDRGGEWVTRARVRAFAPGLPGFAAVAMGGIGVLAMGTDAAAMARAAAFVAREGGGVAAIGPDGREFFARLPNGGAMVGGGFAEAVAVDRGIGEVLRLCGYRHGDWLYSTMFLCSDFLPGLRLTPRGLWDVRERRALAPPEPLRRG